MFSYTTSSTNVTGHDANFNGYSPPDSTDVELLVGRCNHLGSFVGYLHDFRYYARELPANQIKAIYETEKTFGDELLRGLHNVGKSVVSYGGTLYGSPIQVNSAGGGSTYGDLTTGLPAPKKVLWDPEPEQTRFNNYTAMVPSFNGSSQYLEIPYNQMMKKMKYYHFFHLFHPSNIFLRTRFFILFLYYKCCRLNQFQMK